MADLHIPPPASELDRRSDVIQRAGMLIDDAAVIVQRLLSDGEPDEHAARVACMLVSKIAELNEARTIALLPRLGELSDAERVVDTREEARARAAARIRTGGAS